MNRRFGAGPLRPKLLLVLWLGLFLTLLALAAPGIGRAIGFAGITRDTFPVFNDPPMLAAGEAESRGIIFPRDPVIGVSIGGRAKAYPISIMGFHELGNDTLSGVPIAVSW